MHISTPRRIICAVLLSSVSCVALEARASEATAAAETAAAEETGGIEDIVVTARKRSESLMNVPVQVTALSGETLENRGVTSLSQFSQQIPGFFAAPTLLLDALYIRGIGTSPTNPGFEQSVGMFIDGVYYGNGRWGNQGFFDLESAQVMKGPQGVYFGKNTIAGAIELTTRDPGDEFEGTVSGGYEFNQRQRYVQAGISIPLSDTLGVRVFGRYDKMRGWVHNLTTNQWAPNNEDKFVRITIKYEPTDSFTATLKSAFYSSDNNGPTNAFVLVSCAGPGNTASPTPFGPSPVPCGREFITYQSSLGGPLGDFFNKYSNFAHTLKLDWEVGPGSLTSITGWNHFDNRGRGGSSASPNNSTLFYHQQKNTAVSQELRYVTDFEGPVNLIAGVYYLTTDFYTNNRGRVLPDAIQGTVGGKSTYTWNKDSFQDGETIAAFGEVTWNITPMLEAAVGGRYTQETKKSQMRNIEAAPNLPFLLIPNYAADQKFKDFSPSATLTWRPSDDLTIYGAYKSGYKSGGFSHGGTIFFLPPAPPPALASFVFGSESVQGFEGGFKGFLADRRLRYELVGYAYDYSDLQVNAYNSATNSFTVQNAATAEQRGIELSTAFAATDAFTLSGSVNYNRTRFKDFIAPCNAIQIPGTAPCNVPLGAARGQDLSGHPLPFAPTWSGRIDATYDIEMRSGYGIELNGGAQFSGDYYLATDGREANKQPEYVRFNAAIALTAPGDAFKLELIGQNLTNKFVAVIGAERSGAGRDIVNQADRARSVELRATYNF